MISLYNIISFCNSRRTSGIFQDAGEKYLLLADPYRYALNQRKRPTERKSFLLHYGIYKEYQG